MSLENIIREGIKLFNTADNKFNIFDYILKELLSFTRSDMGIIGQIKYTNDIPILVPLSITNITWTNGLNNNLENITFKLDHDNLLYAPIKYKKTILTNDPSSHPMSKGVPAKHLPIKSYIATPVIDRDKVIGYIGIANRKNGYHESFINYFEKFASLFGTIITLYKDNNIIQQIDLFKGLAKIIMDNCRDGILILDRFFKIIMYNTEILKIFKLGNIDLRGLKIDDLFPQFNIYFTTNIKDSITKTIIIDINKKSMNLTITLNKLDNKTYMVYIIDLSSSYDNYKDLLNRKDEYIKILNHEVRNPLQSIVLSSYILYENIDSYIDDNLTKDHIEILYKSCRRMKYILNSMKQLYNIETKNTTITLTLVNIIYFFNSTLQEYKKLSILKDCNVNVKIEHNDKLNIYIDEKKLKNIISGILTHCLLTTSDNHIYINFYVKNSELHIDIKDKNVYNISKINELSSSNSLQTDLSKMILLDTKNVPNINTSISVSRQLIKLLNGSITINSIENHGTNYMIKIPTIVSLNEKIYDIDIQKLRNTYINVLIIDENIDIINRFKKIFEQINSIYVTKIKVNVLMDVLKSIDLIKQSSFDIIYYNMTISVLSGLEFAKIIKKNNYKNILIGLGENVFVIDSINVFNEYAVLYDDIIIKSFDIDTILQSVITYVKNK